MSDLERLLCALGLFAFGLGFLLGRFHGRREVATTLRRTVGDWAAARRARIAQDAREPLEGFRDLPGLSKAERDAWDARELP